MRTKREARDESSTTAGNLRLAKSRWQSVIGKLGFKQLKALTEQYEFSIAHGDLVWLERGWYVTHTGLVRLARRYRCAGIHVKPIPEFCNAQAQRWAFEATVYKSKTVEDLLDTAMLIRQMCPRLSLVQRCAWLKLVPSIAPCAKPTASAYVRSKRSGRPAEPASCPRIEEIATDNLRTGMATAVPSAIVCARSFASTNSIRTWSSLMRPTSAAVKTLREATREQVENFVAHLADWAEKDRNALLCQLNSYLAQKEGAA